MSDVEFTTYDLIVKYPGKFQTKMDVIHHILCQPDNGYKWVEGEPVSAFQSSFRWTQKDYIARQEQAYGVNWNETPIFKETLLTQVIRMRSTVMSATQRSQEWGEISFPVLPFSEDSLIMNVPEDVTLDWAAAVTYMRRYLVEHGWSFPIALW